MTATDSQHRAVGGARPADGGPVLVGDVGGTKTRLAVFERSAGQIRRLHRETYASSDFPSLAEIVKTYLDAAPERPERGCLALAAPRSGSQWHFTNLDWKLDSESLRAESGLESLRLCNDFDAVAYAIEELGDDDLVELQAGRLESDAPRAVLGAGTGLGAAFSVALDRTGDDARHRVISSEAGHVDFAPRDDREQKLLELLRERHGHVSYERVLSGSGLEAIYESLLRSDFAPESAAVRQRFEKEDAAAVISELGLKDEDALCVETLDLFASVYGAKAGNLALLVEARGGVYIAGGIAPRILPKLQDGSFMRAFRAKGRLTSLLEEIPVHVITRDDVGLLGAAVAAFQQEDAR